MKTTPTRTTPKVYKIDEDREVGMFYFLWNVGEKRGNIPFGIRNKKLYESIWHKHRWKLVTLIEDCEGGEELISDLLESGFFVADVYWERTGSEKDRQSFEAQVCLVISNDEHRIEEMVVEEATWQRLQKLMSQTWSSCHIWNNPELRNSEVVMNFNLPMQEDPLVAITL